MNDFLILGTIRDPHVKWVTSHLEELGVSSIIMDALESTPFSFEFHENGDSHFVIDEKVISNEIVIWNRTKLYEGSPFYFEIHDPYASFKAPEWNAAYRLINTYYYDRVLNNPISRAFLLKPYQQMVAAKLGFKTPETLISNRKNDLLNFIDCNNSVIMKGISGCRIEKRDEESQAPLNLMTMMVNRADINKASEKELEICPSLMQTNIKKKYELRIVVIDREIFAFKIPSQDFEYTSTDWRYGNHSLPFTLVEIEEELQEKILIFMREMQLFSGSIDLIKDINNQYWFLECNQDGQWGWLDMTVNQKISKAFANAFYKKIATKVTPSLGHVLSKFVA